MERGSEHINALQQQRAEVVRVLPHMHARRRGWSCKSRVVQGGSNIKALQRDSGASRITFEKEGGSRSTSQACYLIASDIDAALAAAKVVLQAVAADTADARAELKKRVEAHGSQLLALLNSKGEPPVDATREKCVEQHRITFGSACLSPDQQTKMKPAHFAAVDFEIWQLQWAVESKLVHTS